MSALPDEPAHFLKWLQARGWPGAAPDALRLLEVARAGPLSEGGRATAELLAAQLAAHLGEGERAPSLLLAAAGIRRVAKSGLPSITRTSTIATQRSKLPRWRLACQRF